MGSSPISSTAKALVRGHAHRELTESDRRRSQFGRRNVLDHADELAKRFEDYEPAPGDERPVEEYLLHRAALARARSEQQVIDAIVAARATGPCGPGSLVRRTGN